MKWKDRVLYSRQIYPRHRYLPLILLASVLAFFAAIACNSGPSTQKPEDHTPAPAAQNSNGPGIDLNCVVARLQNPPDSFHYSFKKNGNPDFGDDEADVSPQLIDGFFKSNVSDVTNPPITGKVHALRSDADGWRMATGSLSGIMALAGAGGLVDQNAVRQGTESVNCYDTTKYSVDTTRGDTAGTAILLGTGGFIKGVAWVTSDGCPVKMSLDEEFHHDDGSVTRNHFEEAITKK